MLVEICNISICEEHAFLVSCKKCHDCAQRTQPQQRKNMARFGFEARYQESKITPNSNIKIFVNLENEAILATWRRNLATFFSLRALCVI